jgi:2-polyprenyl-3-methyl-5-hydroxy-6-metoxy-1,4-benzoquinol methylase
MNFTETYYKSANYTDYLSRRFDQLAQDVKNELGLDDSSRVLDFGCGYGGLMAALHDLGIHNIVGTDISQWAIDYGKEHLPHVAKHLQYYNRNILSMYHTDLVILDVLEHCPVYEIESILALARKGCAGKMLVRIPVSAREGEMFVLPVSNNDLTHITCHTKEWWIAKLLGCGFYLVNTVHRERIYDSPGVHAAVYAL